MALLLQIVRSNSQGRFLNYFLGLCKNFAESTFLTSYFSHSVHLHSDSCINENRSTFNFQCPIPISTFNGKVIYFSIIGILEQAHTHSSAEVCQATSAMGFYSTIFLIVCRVINNAITHELFFWFHGLRLKKEEEFFYF